MKSWSANTSVNYSNNSHQIKYAQYRKIEKKDSYFFHSKLYLMLQSIFLYGLPWWLSGKETPWQCRKCRLDPWVRKIPWRRNGNILQYSCLGKSNGQKSLVGYSSWGHTKSDMTRWLNNKYFLSELKQFFFLFRYLLAWFLRVYIKLCIQLYIFTSGSLLYAFSMYFNHSGAISSRDN